MLNGADADQQILTALAKEFYGPNENEDYEHLASLFMSAKICDLNKSEEYFCYMQKLLISSGNVDKPAYLKHYLGSFPGHIPDAVEQHLKEKSIPLSGLSLSQLHRSIMETWQEHCLEKRVVKDFKRHSSMFSPDFCKDVAKMPDWRCGAHNRGHFGCDSCSCKKTKQPKYTSAPRFHPDKGYKHKTCKRFKKKAYFKKTFEPANKEKCFICGKKGHWANKCPNKKKNPQLVAMFPSDLDPTGGN